MNFPVSADSVELLLDTDIVSAKLRRDPRVQLAAADYQVQFGRFTISAMTRFEILRGLRAARAVRRERLFQAFVANLLILPITDDIFESAANVYATLHRQGRLIPDADLLIGSTALVHGLALATNNEDDFNRIPGLSVVNWLRPQ